MKRSNLLILAVLLVLSVTAVMAQDDGYNNYTPLQTQTKTSPAGLVVDPGSQLLYVLDTGIRADDLFAADPDYQVSSVSELDATLTAPAFQSFISVTNTNPTDAVTVHFRYFNNECEDVLDFLVVLTCNDTMMVDPFNFTIPTTTVNVSQRFFGAVGDQPVPAIPASKFGDGRFFLFVTASGDPINSNDNIADWLFPKEQVANVSDLVSDCPAVDPNTVGSTSGISDNNLHILNASAISFNYLTGFWTNAVPTAALGNVPAGSNDAGYLITAWTRPAVNLAGDDDNGSYGYPDGDYLWPAESDVGRQVPKYTVLAGSEPIWADHLPTPSDSFTNEYYLRHEAHGGDFRLRTQGSFRIASQGGALGWALFPIEGAVAGVKPSEQFLNMVSTLDDYNGSNNIKGLSFDDFSYRLDPVVTFYNLTVYNNSEDPVTPDTPEVIISPPPPGEELRLVIAVKCINAWTVGGDPSKPNQIIANLKDFSVQDLYAVGGAKVQAHLAVPVAENDEVGPGWVRFARVITTLDYYSPAGIFTGILYDGVDPTIVTEAQRVVRTGGFAGSDWLPQAANASEPIG